MLPLRELGHHSVEAFIARCHYCQVAHYLEEESSRHSEKVSGEILALARAWHDRCENCECGCYVKKSLLQRVRALLAHD